MKRKPRDPISETAALSPLLAGVAGEYYVGAELTRRGYLASITLRNTKGVDIVCSNSDATKSVAIQVKTKKGTGPSWLMGEKSESFFSRGHFYVFVRLNDGKAPPDYFIVPSKKVADYIRDSHATWLKTPGKNGHAHRDSAIRKFTDAGERYKGRWDLLGLDS